MRAIQTRYAGYHFRSRLEARWAVFFDSLELPWEYEPEGFVLPNGQWYLPDFRVRYPGQTSGEIDGPHNVWFEVKPRLDLVSIDEWSKLEEFDGIETLVLLDGIPAQRMYMRARDARAHGRRGEFDDGLALWSRKGRLWWDDWSSFYVHDACGVAETVCYAIDMARGSRFEHRAA